MSTNLPAQASITGALTIHQVGSLLAPVVRRVLLVLLPAVPVPSNLSRRKARPGVPAAGGKQRQRGGASRRSVVAENRLFRTIAALSSLYRVIPTCAAKVFCVIQSSVEQRRLYLFLDVVEQRTSNEAMGSPWVQLPQRVGFIWLASWASSLRETWLRVAVGRNQLTAVSLALRLLTGVLASPLRSPAVHEALLSNDFAAPSRLPSPSSAFSAVLLALVASLLRDVLQPLLSVVVFRSVLTVLEGAEYWMLRRYLSSGFLQHALDETREWTVAEAEEEQHRSRWKMIRALVYRMVSSVLSTCVCSHPLLAGAAMCEARALRYLAGPLVATASFPAQLSADMHAMQALLCELAAADHSIDLSAAERAESAVVGFARDGTALHTFQGAVELLRLRVGYATPLFYGVEFTVMEVVATQVLGSWFRLLYRLQTAS
jgi:hypothetical protein